MPTLADVLNTKTRPRLFTRTYRTGVDDYDPVRVGWKVTALEKAPAPNAPGVERRRIYDTSQTGRGNGGHDFGERLTDDERMAVVEYLKTL